MLIAEADKLRRQHDAGSAESRKKVRQGYQKMAEKDLHALIDERVAAATKSTAKKGKSLTFASAKEARKYLASLKNGDSDSSSDSE